MGAWSGLLGLAIALALVLQFYPDAAAIGLARQERARRRILAGDLAGVLMLFAGDLAGVRVRAALRLGWAGLADLFQRPIASRSFVSRPPVRVGVVPAELL